MNYTNKEFVHAYIEAMFFTEDENIGSGFTSDDIDLDSMAAIETDCGDFLEKAEGLLTSDNMEQAGHDFWLTRNGHGTGFWDREEKVYSGKGEILSQLAHDFGSSHAFFENGNVFVE